MRLQTGTWMGGRSPAKGTPGFLALACLCAAAIFFQAGCAGGPQYFRAADPAIAEDKVLAILPLLNLSRYENAPEIVMNSLVVEMLDAGDFGVIDPGLVETVVLERRLRLTDRLPLETIRDIGAQLGVDYLLLGTVNEFRVVQDRNKTLPTVSIALRIISCADGQIVWAATHSKRGDEGETVFGMGRILTLEKLAAVTVKEMAETLRH